MYTIHEAAALTGVSKDMIRHYEKMGLLSLDRAKNRYRLFSESDLLRIVMIRQYSNMGVELKSLTQYFSEGDLQGLTEHLSRQAESLELMQKQLVSRTRATRQTLRSLQNKDTLFDRIALRMLLSRDHLPEDEYTQFCSRLSASGYFFRYYYLQQFALEAGQYIPRGEDRGLMLYAPLPFEIEDLIVLPEQMYYQKTLRVPQGHYLESGEIREHIDRACAQSALTTFSVITYQVFSSQKPPCDSVISLEIPLETPVSLLP